MSTRPLTASTLDTPEDLGRFERRYGHALRWPAKASWTCSRVPKGDIMDPRAALSRLVAQQGARAYALATVMETQGSASAKPSSKALNRCPRATADGLGGWRLRRIGCLQGRVGVLGDRGGDDRRHRSERRGAWGWNALRRTHAGFRRSGAPAAATLADGPCRIAEALCTLADLLGFDVIVDDGGATWQRYVAAKRLITDDLDYSHSRRFQTTSSSSRPNTRATTNRSSALWPPRPDTSR